MLHNYADVRRRSMSSLRYLRSNSWSQLRKNLQHSARLQWTAVTLAYENIGFSSLFAAGHATESSFVGWALAAQ